ncbi:MAG: zinc ABC transporter substrate-binding protein [Bacteroidetes bacterium]|nr:zinc ABC transporter substrate-binding protein [Bacteroidota bacterium]
MHTHSYRNIIAALLLLAVASCGKPEMGSRPLVVTSIPPLGDWIAAVGGDAIDVLVLVPPASSPHTFELTPGQLREASRASLVVLNGAGLEFWSDRLIENLRNPKTPVLRLSDGVALLQTGTDTHAHDTHGEAAHGHNAHGHGTHGHGTEGNPHFWLDPVVADSAVGRIATALIRILPEARDSIIARTSAYQRELRRLDADIVRAAATWSSSRFIGDHASWSYFARRYGLEEAGVIEELPGREISAREMAGLIRLMRDRDIQAVFADARKSTRAADILREETGARIALLDPLGDEGGYIGLMRFNLEAIDRVLR